MASEAIVLIDLIPLACIIISLGHILIDPSLGGAITIAYSVREVVAAGVRDGVQRRASRRQLKRLLRREIVSRYRTLTADGSQGPLEAIYGRGFNDK